MKERTADVIALVDLDELPNATATPIVNQSTASPSVFAVSTWLLGCVKRIVRKSFFCFGIDAFLRRFGLDWTKLLRDLGDLQAFRSAAEAEIVELKEQLLTLRDQRKVQDDYLSALQSIVSAQDCALSASAVSLNPGPDARPNSRVYESLVEDPPEESYPSCRWIEGGLSFVPGHVRVCPNCNSAGGAPGLVAFSQGRLPVDKIVASKEIIRRANRIDGFDPCTNCAYRTDRHWAPRRYAFDILCISHATACNLACNYCHTIPEERYLQNPHLVPPLYGTVEALIAEGHLSPDSLIQWGGGEPTILREFPELFRLLESHGAFSEVYSSGVRVSEALLEGLARDSAGVMVSLDAGNAQTYTRIKGRPAFDRVVANVGRYASVNPDRTLLKMILFEENLGEVNQFLDIAERTGVRVVCVDTPLYRHHVGDQFIEAAALFCDEAQRRGLEWRLGEVGIVFNPDDRIAERIAEMRMANG